MNFRNTIVILTSNLGAREISDSTPLGFASGEPGAEQRRAEIRRAAMAEVRRQLRPEFLGRLDQIVVFDALGREELRQIAGHQLQDLARRVLPLGCHLELPRRRWIRSLTKRPAGPMGPVRYESHPGEGGGPLGRCQPCRNTAGREGALPPGK